MALYHHISDENFQLAIWKLEESEKELLGQFDTYHTLYEKELASIHNPNRRLEYLGTRILLKYLLHVEVQVNHTEEGKPFINDSNLNISISHTKNFVAVIVSSQSTVGLDIEQKRDQLIRVSYKFISSKEWIDESNKLNHLLLHWCAKETIFKMAHIPLPEFSQDIIVQPFEINYPKGIMMAYETKSELKNRFLLHYFFFNDGESEYAIVYSTL